MDICLKPEVSPLTPSLVVSAVVETKYPTVLDPGALQTSISEPVSFVKPLLSEEISVWLARLLVTRAVFRVTVPTPVSKNSQFTRA